MLALRPHFPHRAGNGSLQQRYRVAAQLVHEHGSKPPVRGREGRDIRRAIGPFEQGDSGWALSDLAAQQLLVRVHVTRSGARRLVCPSAIKGYATC